MMTYMDQTTTLPATTLELPITGMTCAACAARIEKTLNKLPAVHAAVNFATERARIDYDPLRARPAELVTAIRKAGYDVPGQVLELSIEDMTCTAFPALLPPSISPTKRRASITRRPKWMRRA
jgi:Cu+-exporting ATPase